MLVVWSWLFYLLGIKCDEDKEYKRIKAKYDRLKNAKTMKPPKKYLENLLLFPDVTWGNGKTKVKMVCIENGDSCTRSEYFILYDANTSRDEIHHSIVDLVTNCNPNEKESKNNMMDSYMNDKVTEDDLRATIKELKKKAEISKAEGYFLKHLLCEEIIKEITKMGSDCKLKGEEKLEKLKKHVLQMPCALKFECGKGVNVATAYEYFVFTIGDKRMKSEIIKVKRINSEEQTIQDLEEYVTERAKETTGVMKEELKSGSTQKEETNVEESKQDSTEQDTAKKDPTKQVTVKKEEPKKTKIILIVVSVIVGIMIILTVVVILLRKR
ncbi:hypothetical protein ECANGB1_2148 [Enterospora canceri]|uniref:Uncharacterized protein n=1 Tax=Enterospora canceri TaxID=1081671 RepID=A0A1Y1S523_9MICR|nr:hypothetical protein ECANGB1_2148 [Enterospora canceri]